MTRTRVSLKRPPKGARSIGTPVAEPLPMIELPPARIMLPTPPQETVEPGRPRRERSPLGVAPAPREGLGPEGQPDMLLRILVLTAVWIALEVFPWR